eukprot:Colp12_sorted_trinity150504_noHs@33673
MGQEQSSNKSKNVEAAAPTTVAAERPRTVSNIFKRSNNSKEATAPATEIVTVHELDTQDSEEPEIRALADIPMFNPLLKNSLDYNWFSNFKSDPSMARIPVEPVVRMCLKVQTYMHDCARSSAERQAELMTQVKKVDSKANTILSEVKQKHGRQHMASGKLSEVAVIARELERLGTMARAVTLALDRLNQLLPPSERLEPFEWSSSTVIGSTRPLIADRSLERSQAEIKERSNSTSSGANRPSLVNLVRGKLGGMGGEAGGVLDSSRSGGTTNRSVLSGYEFATGPTAMEDPRPALPEAPV